MFNFMPAVIPKETKDELRKRAFEELKEAFEKGRIEFVKYEKYPSGFADTVEISVTFKYLYLNYDSLKKVTEIS